MAVAAKGLGRRGGLTYQHTSGTPCPLRISGGQLRVPPQTPLLALIHTLMEQRLVALSPAQQPPNGGAYVQHKNAQKCSLIFPMLDFNARCTDPYLSGCRR